MAAPRAQAITDPRNCEGPILDLVNLKEDVYSDEEEVKLQKRKAREALRAWKEWEEELKQELSGYGKRKNNLINEIYQLLGLCGVFVGIVFSAVLAERVKCEHIWIPNVLFLLPFFAIYYFIKQKLEEIRSINDDINLKKSSLRVHQRNLANLKVRGYLQFDFRTDGVVPRLIETERTGITPTVILGFVAVFWLVFLGAFLHILCFTWEDIGSVTWNDYTSGRILPS